MISVLARQDEGGGRPRGWMGGLGVGRAGREIWMKVYVIISCACLMSHTPSSYICHLNTEKKTLVYGFNWLFMSLGLYFWAWMWFKKSYWVLFPQWTLFSLWVPPGYSPFSVLPFTIKFVDVIISAKSTSLPNVPWHSLLLASALSLIRQRSKTMKGFLWSSPEEGHS